MNRNNFIKRFHSNYAIADSGCWEWQKSRNTQGYASVKLKEGDTVIWMGHRISYHLFNGAIPEGAVVRHTCDNPCCVNPEHLVIGTDQDNRGDMVSRGRSKSCGKRGVTETHRGNTKGYQKADKNWQAKLDWNTVRAIRADTDLTLHKLSDKYGISVSQAHRIRNNLSWLE